MFVITSVLFTQIFVVATFLVPMHDFNLFEVVSGKTFEEDITFHLYHRDCLEIDDEIFINDTASLEESRFDQRLPTKFIIHGWTDHKDTPWVVHMREVMAQTKKWNVIVVDWAPLSNAVYKEAVAHSKLTARKLKEFTVFLAGAKGISYSTIHYIGHSLGAQISGVAGFQLQNENNRTIGRITGLDPAAPRFEWPEEVAEEDRLDEGDANFVDVIHTNAGNLGVEKSTGHVDFYPNGGEVQPGCGSLICSHIRACEYWTASVIKPFAFKAYLFKSWNDYLDDKTHKLNPIFMGIGTNPLVPKGLYFLETTDKPPFVFKSTVTI